MQFPSDWLVDFAADEAEDVGGHALCYERCIRHYEWGRGGVRILCVLAWGDGVGGDVVWGLGGGIAVRDEHGRRSGTIGDVGVVVRDG